MVDFFEIDFLDVESSKSGDAISIRYQLNGQIYIHVVDGGYQDTGDKIVNHIKQYYNNPSFIDNVVVTHSDGDHVGGIKKVLEEFEIGALWMLRPWNYADELIDRFKRFISVENLIKRLKDIYSNLTTLEEIAIEKNIPIYEPFQGEKIGEFIVMAPTKARYLDLIVESEKTPESIGEQYTVATISALLIKTAAKAINFLKAAWGDEVFSTEETSAENEMSIIQSANLCGKNILLTGDAGLSGLTEAADYAPFMGLSLPGLDYFQVPHHGSRRNVSTDVLDRWLGPRLTSKSEDGQEKFYGIISATKKDEDHPRKAVVRAVIHRGGGVVTTGDNNGLCVQRNAPNRGWSSATKLPYPEEQEE